MNWHKILKLAKQGHPLAISMLVNQACPFPKTTSKALWRSGQLELWLEAQQTPPLRDPCLAYLQTGFQNLAAPTINQVHVFCCIANHTNIVWHQVIQLKAIPASHLMQPQLEPTTNVKINARSLPASRHSNICTLTPASNTMALTYRVSCQIPRSTPASATTKTSVKFV